ncbi:toxin glutamine deamidase domain-containing protein [Streptomyces sp. NPDC046859]|uniref:toxin glutamine deamidase domain-containing protein n=1 Tax=Streptomyces sp. NPDC046859 TaxID=3155734 RepID=UPI0033E9EE2A
MMLPDELEWVLEMLGYRWPTADEDKLRDCAEVWRQFGEKVNELHGTANGAARQVTAHNAGESIDKFVKTYEKFDGGGGGDGYLRNAAEAAFLIANVLEACAYLVEFAKWAVIAQLIALVIEIIAAHAAAPFTFGLSEVAGLGATQITRLIVRRLLDELKQALLEAIVETMKEPAISAIEAIITDLVRQTVNVGFGAQEGYDVGATLKAGGTAGLDALKQSPQTFAEGVRDSLGQKAGSRARHAIDSRIDGYDGTSGLPDGDVGSDPGSDSSSRSSSSSDSPSSNSPSSNSDSNSGSSTSDANGSDSSTTTRSGNGTNLPGTNIGNGISADTGGNNIGGPNVGLGPDSGSGPGSDSSGPSTSDTPFSRPTQAPSDSSLSDFDDPSPGSRSPIGSDSPTGSSGTPSTSGPSHTGGGSPVSGLSSPSPQSAPTHASSSSPSSSPTGGSIGTQIDSLAASTPTQSNAAPTPTAGDASPTGSGGRPDGGSGIPTSPTAAAPAGTAPATGHSSGGPSGGSASPTSPHANSGPARNPSASTPGTAPTAGTGPASTPRTTGPTVPRSTPTADGRVPGTGDSRTPGTPDNRIPAQRPGGTPTGDAGTTPRNAPSTPPGDRTAPRGTTPGNPTTPGDGNTSRPRSTTPTPNDGTPSRTNPSTAPGDSTSRNTPGARPSDTSTPRNNASTTPGDNSASRNNPGTTANDRGDRTPPRTTTPGNPSTTPRGDSTPPRSTPDQPGSSRTPTPGQNPAQSTPPASSRPTTSPSTPTPGGSTGHSPSTSPGPTTHNPTSQGTPGTANQPGTGTPSRPPQQPAGSTPNQPGAQPQPHTQQPPASTPNHHQQPQVTPVPIHHVTTTPSGQPTPSAPHNNPDSGPTTPDRQSTPDNPKPRDVPTPASETRNTNPPGGVTDPTRAEQDALENSVPRDENGDPTRPPDPADGPWVQRINGESPDAPGRSNNCVDTALSTVDTYAGNPTAAGARTPDLDADGNPSDRGERGGRDRIENTLGARFSDMGNGREAFNRLENTLRDSGHGSQAVIITQDANGRAHAWNAVNHNGQITYIDAQTGQQSRNPLHSGDHGVFAIPLDSNRQPVTPDDRAADATDTQRPSSEAPPSTSADRRAPDEPAGAPEEPAGTPDETEDSEDDEGDNTGDSTGKDPERLGSTPFEGDQPPEHLHYGVAGDQAQRDFREHRDIRQIDLDPVYDTLRDFANNDNAGLRDLLEGSQDGRTWRRDELADRIPGFDDLSRGQQAAAVGVLARLSNDFHMNQGVGASPYRRGDDQSAYHWSESEEAQEAREAHRQRDEKRQTNFPGNDDEKFKDSRAAVAAANGKPFSEVGGSNAASASPAQRTRHHLDETYGASVADQIVDATADMKPNFSGRNFAVMEVYDPETQQTHYVADSSFSHAGPRPDHSEPHLGGWIERLNEDRAAEGQQPLVPTHLYTEREPCGHPSESKGHADCGGYIRAYLPEQMGTTYATGYRKGAQVEPFSDPREGIHNAAQAMEADFQDHLNKVADILKAYALPTPKSPA